jgi:hypothetical protein
MNAKPVHIFRLNSECENALIDFPFHDNNITWIQEHSLLFASIEKLNEAVIQQFFEKNNYIQQFKMLYLINEVKH